MFDLRKPIGARPVHAGYAVLLTLLAVLTVGAVALFVTVAGSGRSERRLAESEMAADVLMRARAAIIGYSVAQMSGGSRPGQMLAPDTLENANYDGMPDNGCLDSGRTNGLPALTGAFARSARLRCLGRLPWKPLGLDLATTSQVDPVGQVPWFAVSQNLADPNFCMEVLNSNTALRTVTAYTTCPQSSGPAWPWLKVCDAGGRIISDRVAFVLIMPGPPISTQGRTQSRRASLSGPRDFLDAIPNPAGWAALPAAAKCSRLDNAGLTDEFVIGNISASFNDRLVYVTIDELMEDVERRVATEVRESFLAFKNATNGLPWLAPLANPTMPESATIAVPGTRSGLVPFAANLSGTSSSFLSELSWRITQESGGPSFSPKNTNPNNQNFRCYGGAFECRLITTAGGEIAHTVSANDLASGSIATPSTSCTYTFASDGVEITGFTCRLNLNQQVDYGVAVRPCCSGTFTRIGVNVRGMRTRTVIVSASSAAAGIGKPSTIPSNATTTAKWEWTSTNSADIDAAIIIVDNWSPLAPVGAPFDVSAGPYLPKDWSGSTGGQGRFQASLRAQPIVPAWYFNEKWYELAYAAMSTDAAPNASGVSSFCSTNCFSVGGRSNIDAAVIVAGPQLAALSQNRYRPSPTVADFLEAPNTTGATTKFFAAEKLPRNPTYADTIATVPR